MILGDEEKIEMGLENWGLYGQGLLWIEGGMTHPLLNGHESTYYQSCQIL